jgi:hypothetical protein
MYLLREHDANIVIFLKRRVKKSKKVKETAPMTQTAITEKNISPAEKAVYDACYRERLPMIHIVNRGLDGKFNYPSGRDLSGCSDGFLLVLAPYADYSAETAAARITRAQCLNLNAYAADLATVTLR